MISVDTVYQTVLALANKEQRGYITPQEFNLHADHAQMDIFEQYFYDLNQFKRLPGNDTGYADMVNLLEDKISIFKKGEGVLNNGHGLISHLGDDFYRMLSVTNGPDLNAGDSAYRDKFSRVVEKITYEDYRERQQSPLTKATLNRPVWWAKDGNIYFSPNQGQFLVRWIRKPKAPKWTYIVVNEKPLYDGGTGSGGQDFELHPSEQTELVIKILQLSGITIKDFNLVQAAGLEENRGIQQEKL